MAVSKLFNLKITWRDAVGFTLSAGLLWLTWRQSGIAKEGLELNPAKSIWLAFAMVAFLLSLVVHVFRAYQLWQGVGAANRATIAKSLFIGNFFNVVLPGNLGEGVRAWHFHQTAGVGFLKSAAGILTEKFVDALLFAIILLVLFVQWANAYNEPVFWMLYAVWIGIAGCTALIVLMHWNKVFAKLVWQCVPGRKLRKALFKTYQHLFYHLQYLKQRHRLWSFSIMGYVLLSLNLVQYFFVLKASGIEAPLNQVSTIFLMAMVMVVINVTPSAPGSAGVVHYGIFATLTLAAKLLGCPQQGVAFAMAGVYLHLSYFLPETLIGSYLVWRERQVLTLWKKE